MPAIVYDTGALLPPNDAALTPRRTMSSHVRGVRPLVRLVLASLARRSQHQISRYQTCDILPATSAPAAPGLPAPSRTFECCRRDRRVTAVSHQAPSSPAARRTDASPLDRRQDRLFPT